MTENVPTVGKAVERIGIIGDVHGEDQALNAVLTHVKKVPRLDALLCTGDIPAKHGVGDAERCCILLQEAGVYTIRGNHDRWQVDEGDPRHTLHGDEPASPTVLAFLRTLPRTLTFDTPFGTLLLCHGLGKKDMAGVYPGGDDEPIREALKAQDIYNHHRFMVAGHTHKRMVRRVGTVTIINPGTLRFDENPGFAVADFTNGTVQFYHLTPFTHQISDAERLPLFPPTE